MKKVSIIYFSRTGENVVNGEIKSISKGFTEILAERINKYILDKGYMCSLVELVPEVSYSGLYDSCNARAKEEYETNALVPYKKFVRCGDDNLKDCDLVLIGFPLWYRSFPRIISTFLEMSDWTGKKIVPFCTNDEGYYGIMHIELAHYANGAIMGAPFSSRGADVENVDIDNWLSNVLK